MTSKMAHHPERLAPVHPGEILNEEFLLPMNITQYRLAKAIGVDARRIHSIVHGERSITAESALLLSRFFGNSAEFWMGLQSQYDLEAAEDRLSHRLRCGGGPLAGVTQISRSKRVENLSLQDIHTDLVADEVIQLDAFARAIETGDGLDADVGAGVNAARTGTRVDVA